MTKMTDREALKALVEVGDAVASELVTHEARDSVGGLCSTARNVGAAWHDAARAAKEVLARGEPEVVAWAGITDVEPERIARIFVFRENATSWSQYQGRRVRPLRYADE